MPTDDLQRQRRDFLRQAIGLVPTAALLGSGLAPSEAAAAPVAPPYKPSYFNAEEWLFLNAAVDRLIPSNEDGPGAVELGVPEFIDRQMDTGYGHGEFWYMNGPFVPDVDFTLGYQLRFTPRELYRAAIADINGWCQKTHGKKFSELDGAAQDEVLTLLQKGTIELPNIPKPGEFFLQIQANTREGYFADPMYGGNRGMGAWKMIGFPGARADFKDWATQPGKVYPLGPVSINGEKA
jgi:gluconate 2-dehydrogenase gamma chain